MSSAPGNASPRAPRRDALRNDRLVLEAARAVFAERGPQAGMEEIAARAGLGVGTIYRRFNGKEALLDAIGEQLVQELDDAASAALEDPEAGRGLERFLEFVGTFNEEKRRYSAALLDRVRDERAASATTQKVDALTRNAAASGALAADVTTDDVLALIAALRSVDARGTGGGWRRFLTIHLAGLRAER